MGCDCKRLLTLKGENMTLTKADLVQQVYKNHEELTKVQATESVEAFLRISKDSLIKGSDLLLSGFGKFTVRDKKPRRGRNPQTGEDLTLDARRVVTFKPSGMLRDRVNGS
jgi:integration host factor subunit alpha